MPLVRIVRNYQYPDILRQSPDSLGIWKGYEFTESDIDSADYLVVLNYPLMDIRCRIRKGGALLLVQEPPFERNQYNTEFFPFFDKVVSHLKTSHKLVLKEQAALPWHLDMTYNELMAWDSIDNESRNDEVTWITSNINLFPTHQLRLNFIEQLKKSSIPFRLFGRGFHPVEKKLDVLSVSKYTIAAENFIGKDYWTEKLQDAILSWNVPFYYGCENIQNYLPSNSIVRIDLNKPQWSEDVILNTLSNNQWEKNISDLKEARQIILNQIQFFPRVVNLLESMNLKEGKREYVIPSDPYKKSFFKKLISRLS
jgi:hypothetical protein